jgi:hypothetical protein
MPPFAKTDSPGLWPDSCHKGVEEVALCQVSGQTLPIIVSTRLDEIY